MAAPFVMLVDDESAFVETMTKRLEKRNLKVIAALSGDEALETLSKNRNLDVIILDVKMPRSRKHFRPTASSSESLKLRWVAHPAMM
ncbi:MAG: response regulator [Desulfatiglandaceae bacterium]